MVKCLPATWKTRVWSLGWEDPLEREMATHSSTLAWKILWMEEPGRAPQLHVVAKTRTRLSDFTYYKRRDFPGGASGKEPAYQCRRLKRHGFGFNAWVKMIPWRRAWWPIPVFLPEEFQRQRRLACYSQWGRRELDTTEATERACTRITKENSEIQRKAWFAQLSSLQTVFNFQTQFDFRVYLHKRYPIWISFQWLLLTNYHKRGALKQ